MNTTDKIMALAEKACAEFRPHRLRQHDETMQKLREEIEALARDAERLDWMIFHSAKVRHSSDGEFCIVIWYDDEGPTRETKPFSNVRDAIDTAMQEKQS